MGKNFPIISAVIEQTVSEYFAELPTNLFSNGLNSLGTRWNRYIALEGDYIEK